MGTLLNVLGWTKGAPHFANTAHFGPALFSELVMVGIGQLQIGRTSSKIPPPQIFTGISVAWNSPPPFASKSGGDGKAF